MLYFFFFKQKTAYEMRISDWSSDVCSSDLIELEILCKLDLQFAKHRPSAPLLPRLLFKGKGRPLNSHRENIGGVEILVRRMLIIGTDQEIDRQIELGLIAQFLRELHVTVHIITVDRIDRTQCQIGRATSELQSLMRISYAVFCLKKKKKKH